MIFEIQNIGKGLINVLTPANLLVIKEDIAGELLLFDLATNTYVNNQNLLNENKNQKGVVNGYVPLNEFIKISSQYLNLINDLVTGGSTALLSAEQGKILKNSLDSLATITANKQDVTNQLEITSSQVAQLSWHGKTLFFVNSCTITIPTELSNSYTFNGITLAGVIITWVITAPKTWLFGTPPTTKEKQIFTFMQRGNTNNVLLLGV